MSFWERKGTRHFESWVTSTADRQQFPEGAGLKSGLHFSAECVNSFLQTN